MVPLPIPPTKFFNKLHSTAVTLAATATSAPVDIVPSTITQSAIAIGDSGTTDLLLRSSASQKLTNVIPFTDLQVSLPNGEIIRSTHTGTLPINGTNIELPAYIFPDDVLQNSLVSFSALCNADCTITLTKTAVLVVYQNTVIFRGSKTATDTLWLIDLDKLCFGPVCSLANLSIKLTTDAEFVAFVHATFGSPPSSTFLTAARAGWTNGYPRITASIIAANLPNSIATAKGHLDQTRQRNKRRLSITTVESSTSIDTVPPPANVEESNDVYVQCIPLTDLAHVDLTGRFPLCSRIGNQYVLVFCWDGYVHYEAMPSRKATAYLAAYKRAFEFFKGFDRSPAFLRMDNESSGLLEAYAIEAKFTIQYVPPGTHRANEAEREIRTSKNHIISMLCTTHESFPLDLWDQCLPQAEITINHLRPYKPLPALSAYEGFRRQKYDFIAHPLAPFGTLVVVHDKPAERGSWDPHGVKGFYLGPALQHYHSWRTWVILTQTERISDSLAWFPTPLKLPGSDPHEMVQAAIDDLVVALRLFATRDTLTSAQSRAIYETIATAKQSLNAVINLFSSATGSSSSSLPLVSDDLIDSQSDVSTPSIPVLNATSVIHPSDAVVPLPSNRGCLRILQCLRCQMLIFCAMSQ